MRVELTREVVAAAPVPVDGKRTEIFDSIVGALALRVTGGGAKSFVVRCRVRGQRAGLRVTLGDATHMNPVRARIEAQQILDECRSGVDPRIEREQQAEARRQQHTDDLRWEKVAELYLARAKKKLRNRSYKGVESLLRRHVTPRFKGRLLAKITLGDVAKLLDMVEDKVSIYRRNRALSAIQSLFKWAVKNGHLKASPIVTSMKSEGEKARDRRLTFEELQVIWRAADTLGDPWGRLYQVLLATGQRLGESSSARWNQFDFDNEKIWTLQPDDTKAKRIHIVPLVGIALDLLQTAPRVSNPNTRRAEFVFTIGGTSPVQAFSAVKKRLDAKILELLKADAKARGQDESEVTPLPAWRVHDLRAAAASYQEECLGLPSTIIGSVLNHSMRAYKGVTARYTRGTLIFARRQALQAWSRFLRLLIDGGEVWNAVQKILQPKTERDAARTAEFQRIIVSVDDEAWDSYLHGLVRADTGKVVGFSR